MNVQNVNKNMERMKIIQNVNYVHLEHIEFHKEGDMLDKFQCEYLVHFYRVCFIPNETCIITEFSQFGSFQNLMKIKEKYQNNECI